MNKLNLNTNFMMAFIAGNIVAVSLGISSIITMNVTDRFFARVITAFLGLGVTFLFARTLDSVLRKFGFVGFRVKQEEGFSISGLILGLLIGFGGFSLIAMLIFPSFHLK